MCNHIEIKDNRLIAMEQENYNINNYTHDLNINSSKENIINSILTEEEILNMNINISYEHIHNYINGCTSNDAFGHTCKCSCGYSYIENHTFKPYSNGKKCLKCGYFTNGPTITPITGIKNDEKLNEESDSLE